MSRKFAGSQVMLRPGYVCILSIRKETFSDTFLYVSTLAGANVGSAISDNRED